MKKSAVLFISVILLTQIASYSFNEDQSPTGWEFSTPNYTGENNTSDNNTADNNTADNNTADNNTSDNNTADNNTSDNNTTECTPWNNVACNDEFGCKFGERIPVPAIDEATGEAMLDSDGNQIQVWGCSETSSNENEEESGALPSIGIIGTVIAIGVSFVAVTRREQEE